MIKSKKNYIFIFVLLFSSLIIFNFLPQRILYKKEIRNGEKIIKKIELYKEINGYYPKSLNELTEIYDLNIGEIYCYELQGNKYIFWFGTTLGEGLYYYSDSCIWEDRIR